MKAIYCLFFLLVRFASAQVLEKIGDVFPIQLRSNGVSDIQGTDTPLGKTYVLTHPGATYIALHFSQLKLRRGDSIEVSDAEGGQAYTLTGSGRGNGAAFWSQHVKGDTIVLNAVINSRLFWRRKSVFVIDEYAAGFEALTETICGRDNKENAMCYASSFPTEYNKSRAVARLLINGSGLCTGFLVSESGHLLTNRHCIDSASDALNTDYEFMSEAPTCDSPNSQLAHKGTIYSGATLIRTSSSLDYALVQINNGNPASLFGYLELDDQLASVGGQIYIPQHPYGWAKQLAIYSSLVVDEIDGFCHINKRGSFGSCSSGSNIDLFYYCDTEGGSSGSPIISRATNKVVGLHKCGGCSNGNHATSAHLIRNQIDPNILSPPAPVPVAPPVDPPTTPTTPSPVAPPVDPPTSSTAPTPVEPTAPIFKETPPAPVPVDSPPVPAPTPVCLRRRARCSSHSRCCSGFCRSSGRCR
jgi:hypothetical protein